METTNALLNQFNENIRGRKMLNSSNSILLINPFNKNGMWVFNDNRTGLIEEPFIAGTELFIEFLLQKLGFLESAKTGFKDRKSTRLNSSHIPLSRMPSSA